MGSCVLNERENISSQLKGRLFPSFSQFKAKENQLDNIPVLGIGKGLAGNWGWCVESCKWLQSFFTDIPPHESPLQACSSPTPKIPIWPIISE